MEKILIIGGTGNIGFPLIDYLTQNNDVEIVAGSHKLEHTHNLLKKYPKVHIKHFDFLDPQTFPKAFTGVTKLFFVRPPQLANPKKDMLPFLRYAKKQGLKQIVFISLLGVEHNPMTPHHKIEQLILDLKVPYTFIRPSFFMQNLNTTHLYDLREHHDLFIPAGNSRTSFIDTRDIGEIAAITLTDETYLNQKLNITGPQALSYSEIAQIMTQVLGVSFTYSKPSLFKFRKNMLQRGVKKDFVNVMVMLYLITKLGNANTVTDTAKSILPHAPRTINDYINDYRGAFLK